IVAIRIKGILHEFSTITGVTEDVADIILNLKEVRLRLNDSEQQTLKIEGKGPGTIQAKDIIAPPAVDILNPEHKIATLARDAKLEMEMIAKLGRGYVPAERNKDEGAPVDTIFIDAIFAPEKNDDGPTVPLNDNLFRSVDELEFSVRSQNCLQNADIKYIGELVQKSEQEMLKTKNFGHKSLNEIKEILREMGLELGMKIER